MSFKIFEYDQSKISSSLEHNDNESDDNNKTIRSFPELMIALNQCFSNTLDISIDIRRSLLMDILKRFEVQENELNIFALFDTSKPYTRNLLLTNQYYSLLLLCWNPNMQSKIHDHPCESCILMPLTGTLKEERYSYDGQHILHNKPNSIKFYLKGQVSYMNNDIGLHRISNPRKYVGAISLHLYYPPFNSCRAWSVNQNSTTTTNPSMKLSSLEENLKEYEAEEVKMGSYSIRGLRTPTLEGRLGSFGQVMKQLKNQTKFLEES